MTKLFNSKADLENAFLERSIRRLRIGNKVFILIKYKDHFHLVAGLCPHQKQPLDSGSLNAFGEIICPLHFYRFNLKSGREANNLCSDLEVYPLEINTSGVFTKI